MQNLQNMRAQTPSRFTIKKTLKLLCSSQFAITFCAFVATSPAFASGPYYVDPVNGNDTANGLSAATSFRTIEKARQTVDAVNGNMTVDIRVYLKGGRYILTAPLVFGAGDGGTNGFSVIYQGYAGETAVVSGGRSLTGTWSDANGDGTWEASTGGAVTSRHLYVAGTPAVLARSTGTLPGFSSTATTMTTSLAAIANWTNPTQIEFVWPFDWKWKIVTPASVAVSGTNAILTMKQPGWEVARIGNGAATGAPWFYQNALELLDQPGEFYVNAAAGKVYYRPRAGETMATVDSVLGVIDEEIVNILGGSAAAPVSNITFRNINFQHNTFLQPGTTLAHPGEQSNTLRYKIGSNTTGLKMSPAAVHVKYARNVNFIDSTFQNLGTAGLLLDLGTQDSVVERSIFTQIGLNGIELGDSDPLNPDGRSTATPTNLRVRANFLRNNAISRIGLDAPKAAQGIFAAFVENVTIINNRVEEIGYSGIATGLQWDDLATISGNNTISKNHVSSYLRVGKDGGAYYNLGASPGSVWDGNYAVDQVNEWAAFYPDQGSRNGTWRNNVVERINGKEWAHLWTTSIHDNLFENNFTDTATINNSGVNNTFTGTTVFAPGNAPVAAVARIAAAGVEPAFRYVTRQAGNLGGQTLSDKFSENLAGGWALGDAWSVSDGKLRRAAKAGGSQSSIGELSLADYTVAAKITLSASNSQGAVLARYTNNSNYYALQIAADLGTIELHRVSGGVSTVLASAPQAFTAGSTYDVALRVDGTQLQAFIGSGSTPVLNIADSALTTGRAGVRARVGAVAFDDFIMRLDVAASDNFNDGNYAGWTPTGSWTANAGAVRNADFYEQLLTQGSGVANAIIEAKVTPQVNTNLAGLVGRFVNSSNFYLAHLSVPTQEILLVRKQNGTQTIIDRAPLALTVGVARTLSLRMNGSTIQVYVDGSDRPAVQAFGQTAMPSGGYGLRNARGTADFDDVNVYQ
jgi:Right handed beta helix region